MDDLTEAKNEMRCRNVLGQQYIDFKTRRFTLPFDPNQISMIMLATEKYGYTTASIIADPDIPAPVMGLAADIIRSDAEDVCEQGYYSGKGPNPIKLWEIIRICYNKRAQSHCICALLTLYMRTGVFLPDYLPYNELLNAEEVILLMYCFLDGSKQAKKLISYIISTKKRKTDYRDPQKVIAFRSEALAIKDKFQHGYGGVYMTWEPEYVTQTLDKNGNPYHGLSIEL